MNGLMSALLQEMHAAYIAFPFNETIETISTTFQVFIFLAENNIFSFGWATKSTCISFSLVSGLDQKH